jgi:hypothetical protein
MAKTGVSVIGEKKRKHQQCQRIVASAKNGGEERKWRRHQAA